MSLEKYRKIVAIPRLHEEFIHNETDIAHIMVLDPTGQSEKAYAAEPSFFWNKEYAQQYWQKKKIPLCLIRLISKLKMCRA